MAGTKSGYVQHTISCTLQKGILDKTYGGTFLYHQEPDLVLLGMVGGLDYVNPYLNPYKEFQRWKLHPDIRQNIANGTCLSYGARGLNEDGLHSIPRLSMKEGKGVVLLGCCSAGFVKTRSRSKLTPYRDVVRINERY
jgi:electron-transferring-flavoprotein dehydrogenase